MKQLLPLLFFLGIYVLLEAYVFQAIRVLTADWQSLSRRAIYWAYWLIPTIAMLSLVFYNRLDPTIYRNLRLFLTSFFFINLIAKFSATLVLLGDDIRRGVGYLVDLFGGKNEKVIAGRSEFISKAALATGAIPLTVFSFGIISGAHDYRIRKRTLTFPNLPKAFDGIRILQLSDIHTGSFFSKTAVKGGVDMALAEKPDIIFFTGDLVNNESDEAKDYLNIFNHLKAPLGVYSIMGNHDYGDYRFWPNQEAKMADIRQLHEMHRFMGWDILLNENRIIQVDGQQISLIGVENWGSGRFSKYGDLTKAGKGTELEEFKILLSHDPTHWDQQVRTMRPDIDLTLSGHTHGMQFGVEIGDFRWSPSQYIYPRWADLYQEGNQYLYVNRGFGYIGYPGRVGILPEITVLELKKG